MRLDWKGPGAAAGRGMIHAAATHRQPPQACRPRARGLASTSRTSIKGLRGPPGAAVARLCGGAAWAFPHVSGDDYRTCERNGQLRQ
eukprot:scaffold44_cov411-Prasinococcus_capsulatus_cf.AAC.16